MRFFERLIETLPLIRFASGFRTFVATTYWLPGLSFPVAVTLTAFGLGAAEAASMDRQPQRQKRRLTTATLQRPPAANLDGYETNFWPSFDVLVEAASL
ncbi:MAG: hypothetical protein BGO23_14525 [Solirubrobacterales bacterium 67-14]|nr:MAG: hypothetical protein BGO23_14525 [Solirubrobacterales bacterium 67-14]